MALNKNVLLELNASPLASVLTASTLLAIGLLSTPGCLVERETAARLGF